MKEADKKSRLERIGLSVFNRRSQPMACSGGLHVVVASMRRVERTTVWRAAGAGVASGIATALAALYADPHLGDGIAEVSSQSTITYWSIVLGVTIIASAIEIGFLYWDGLRAARRIHDLAHTYHHGASDTPELLSMSLVRAALEIPNPRTPVFGINPLRGASKWSMFVLAIIYKLKIGISSFVVKAAVKRLGGRLVARGYLEFFAVPVLAAWNALVCYWYMREARMRALGPIYAKDFVELLASPSQYAPVNRRTAEVIIRALAMTIVVGRGVHASLYLALKDVTESFRIDSVADIDDQDRFLAELKALNASDREIGLTALYVAAVLNGHLSRVERQLIFAAQDACQVARSLDAVRAWQERLENGTVAQHQQMPRAG